MECGLLHGGITDGQEKLIMVEKSEDWPRHRYEEALACSSSCLANGIYRDQFLLEGGCFLDERHAHITWFLLISLILHLYVLKLEHPSPPPPFLLATMRPQRLIATFLAAIGSPVTAATGHRQFAQLSAPPLEAAQDRNDLGRRNLVTATFNQLIDHNNPGLGTFKQRYMVNDEFYAGPGSPIILNAPGEDAIDFYTGYTTNRTLPGEFAKRVSGAVVLLEHRYYGDSSPYDQLTTTNLQHLTLDNAIQDLVYFAENVRFDFDTSGTSTPNNAPWVLTGCSYSGALTAWVNAKVPGTFWAYHASSAVVQALEVLPQYFDVVAQAMPQNCSADLQRVVQYVDSVLQHGTDESKLQLRDKFGLAKLQNSDDFGAALLDGLWTWQDTEFDEGYGDFNRFCDYVEVSYCCQRPFAEATNMLLNLEPMAW